jgi:cytochrome c553
MSLCIICHTHDATVPDRDSGSSKKRLCSACHAERLKEDLRHILKVETKRRQEV